MSSYASAFPFLLGAIKQFCYKSSVCGDNAEDPDTYDRYIFYRFLSSLACLDRLLSQ